jgi:hypothetical protein
MHPQVANECGLPLDVRFGTWNARNMFIRVGEDSSEMMSTVKIGFNGSL